MQHLGTDMAGYERASELLRDGEVVALPTASAYVLAVNALDPAALDRLREVLGERRTPTVIVSSAKPVLDLLLLELHHSARSLMDAYWPGPLVLKLPARTSLPAALLDGSDVLVNEPDHPVARSLAEAFGGPLAITTAALAEVGAPHSAADVHVAGVAAILDGGPAAGDPPPTVAAVDAEGRVTTLRAGAVDVG